MTYNQLIVIYIYQYTSKSSTWKFDAILQYNSCKRSLTWDSLDDGRVWNPFEEGFSLVGYVFTAPTESRVYIYIICIYTVY
jgi:hypothetical protein